MEIVEILPSRGRSRARSSEVFEKELGVLHAVPAAIRRARRTRCAHCGRLGASLTYVLPVKWIRAVFVVLMAVAAWKMASIPLPW